MLHNASLRVGVVGCGRAARGLHLPALRRIEGVEIAALADADAAALAEAGGSFGVAARFADHRTLLAEAEVDVVAVCVPAPHHEAVATAVLRAGKHVLIEKPLALDLDACDRLVAEAERAGTRATVGFNLRHHRLVQEARALLSGGVLGPVEAVRSAWTSAIRSQGATPGWRDRRAHGGGALFEIATHHFDLWRFLLGSDLCEVYAVSRSTDTPDESAALTATMTDGTLVSALFSERTTNANDLEIYGREGRLALALYRFDGLTHQRLDDPPDALAGMVKRGVRALPAGLRERRGGGTFWATYEAEWRHFLDAIRTGGPVAATLDDGRRAVRAVLAAIASAETRRPVRLDAAPRALPADAR